MVEKTELILICLVAVALLAIVARKIRVPYPILLTIGGVVLALVPGLPAIHLEPELVFNLFLPPLLYPAAVYTSWRDFRANLRSILPLAIVLVLLTMTATAYLFHGLAGLPLAVGFVFGAIISPPDAVAALGVTQTLRVPRKIIVILEGESLINDATSFISFRFAVAAVMTGAFSLAQALPVWEVVTCMLNGVLFMLIVLQLPQVVHALAPGTVTRVAELAIVFVAVIVLVRFVWMFGATYLPRLLSRTFRRKNRAPWQHTALIAWTGMRGADSLAGALAIPFVLYNGEPFPGRDLILLLTFCVIFATLVLQGLTLTPLVRWLKIVDDGVTEKEERLARLKANEAALARLEAIESSNRARPRTIERLRSEYEDRIRQLRSEAPDEESVRRLFSEDFDELAREVLQTERDTVIELRNEEAINDQALRRIQHDIDLAEARLQRPARKSR